MSFVEGSRGMRLRVHRFGEAVEAAPTVLLLHGFLDSGATWDHVAQHLVTAGLNVLAPDLRGFGGSDRIGRGGYYHFPDYVADVATLVDTLTPKRLFVVGHSMGGTIAALYAATQPERVERLALLEGIGPLAFDPDLAPDRMRTWLRDLERVPQRPKPLASLDEAIARLQAQHPSVAAEVLATRAALLTTQDDAGRIWWSHDPLHRTTSPAPFNVHTFRAFLRGIRCPTLFVSGGPSGWHPPDEGERLACIADHRRVELPGAGHMMHWTAPEALAKALEAFFGEADLAGKGPKGDGGAPPKDGGA